MNPTTIPAPATAGRSGRRVRRVLGVLAITAALTALAGGVAAAQAVNPFDGVNPDVGLFGNALNATWKRLLAAVWGGCIAICGFYVLTSFLKFRKARGRNMPSDLSDASEDLRMSLYALGGTAGVSMIIGSLLFLVQPAA